MLRPDSGDYATARLLYNPRFDGIRPAGIAYCAGDQDIAECLRFARRFDVPFAVRSGGHSYAGWSSSSGLVIDVSKLNQVTLSGGRATVGAGTKLMNLYSQLAASGVSVPGGSCATVGISGLTLGGGHGVVSRAYGLTCDNLTEATIVLADGRTLRCSTDREPDLFWALRGAGNGNFGVVTSLSFRTHPASACTVFSMTWPWQRAASALRAWQSWAPDAPDELWSNFHLQGGGQGQPTVGAGGLHLGDADDLRNRIDQLAAQAGPASSVSVRGMSYLGAMLYMAGCSEVAACLQTARETYTARSDFYAQLLPDQAINALITKVEQASALPGHGAGSVLLTALGGAVGRIASSATAFVHRDSRVLAQYLVSWPQDPSRSVPAQSAGWLDGVYSAMRGYSSGGAYQNYTDPGLKDWRRAYYGANAARLTQVKARYDPDRLFTYPQAI